MTRRRCLDWNVAIDNASSVLLTTWLLMSQKDKCWRSNAWRQDARWRTSVRIYASLALRRFTQSTCDFTRTSLSIWTRNSDGVQSQAALITLKKVSGKISQAYVHVGSRCASSVDQNGIQEGHVRMKTRLSSIYTLLTTPTLPIVQNAEQEQKERKVAVITSHARKFIL